MQIDKMLIRAVLMTLILAALAGNALAQASDLLSPSAKAEFAKDRFIPCIEELTAIIVKQPANDTAYAERARCLYFKSEAELQTTHLVNKANRETALADAEKAISLNPKNSTGYLMRGVMRWLSGNLDEAESDFTKKIELDPTFAKAYNNRSIVREDKKDYDGAIADLDKVIELEPKFAVMAYGRRATLKFTYKRDFAGAIADYTKIIELEPKNVAAYLARAQVKRETGAKYDQLIAEDFSKIYQIDPKYLPMLETGGRYCMEDKGEGACVLFYKDAMALKPGNTQYHLDFAKVAIAMGDRYENTENYRAEAAALLQKDIDTGKAPGETYRWLGKLYDLLKQPTQAEATFSRAISGAPKDPIPYAMRADYYRGLGATDKALADYDKALALAPKYAGAYRSRAVAYVTKGDVQNALADYAKAVELDPKDGLSFLLRGNLLYQEKNYSAALPDIEQALKLNVADSCAIVYRARIKLETGALENGKADLNNAWKCSLTEFYDGEYYAKRGDWGSAIYSYSRAFNEYKSRGMDTAPVTAAIARAEQGRKNSFVPAGSTRTSSSSNSSGSSSSSSPSYTPSAYDQSRAMTAYYEAMHLYRDARANYTGAVGKYNRNVADSPMMQGMMNGTVNRANQQLTIMRTALGNLLRDHGRALPKDKYDEVNELYAAIPSSPF
jgi:tetratricopeptide (TPR) repeat protein